jgi:hypothetical protein
MEKKETKNKKKKKKKTKKKKKKRFSSYIFHVIFDEPAKAPEENHFTPRTRDS